MGGFNDGADKYPTASVDLINATESFNEFSKSNVKNQKWYVCSGEFKYRIFNINNARDAVIQALKNKFSIINIPHNYLDMTSIFVSPDGFHTIGENVQKFDTSELVEEAGLEFDENLGDNFFDKGGGTCQL